jgi:hypothetical protein
MEKWGSIFAVQTVPILQHEYLEQENYRPVFEKSAHMVQTFTTLSRN